MCDRNRALVKTPRQPSSQMPTAAWMAGHVSTAFNKRPEKPSAEKSSTSRTPESQTLEQGVFINLTSHQLPGLYVFANTPARKSGILI